MKKCWLLAVFMFSTSLYASSEASNSDVYIVETQMKGSKMTGNWLRHQGLYFEDKSGGVECHFMPSGLQVVSKGEHGEKDIRRKKLRESASKDKESCVEWCQKWANGRTYSLGGHDCWKMVKDFCTDHGLSCAAASDRNMLRDTTGIPGTIRGLTNGYDNIKKGNIGTGVVCVATAPIKGVAEGAKSIFCGIKKGIFGKK